VKFGDILAKTKKKLDEASNTIDDAGRKTKTIARRLRDVEALPLAESGKLLGSEGVAVIDAEASEEPPVLELGLAEEPPEVK
jgi:DNA recombination protein RmuC